MKTSSTPLITACISLVVATHAFGTSLLLDFGTVVKPDFNTTSSMTFTTVATGINASVTSTALFSSSNSNNNGSILGDIRVNAAEQSNVRMTLQLWDATVGDGFTSAYNPGVAYDWTFVFYDIDSNNNSYDEVTIYTPGAYTVTNSTALTITSGTGFTTFSGSTPVGNVPGQDGLTSFTAQQADAAVGYKITNTNNIDFMYTVGIIGGGGGARNLLVDAKDLITAFAPYDPVTTAVPEPSSAAILLGLSALTLLRRRKS